MDNWAAMVKWAKLSEEAWKQVANELGDAELEDLPSIAATLAEDMVEAGKALKPIQRTRLNLAWNCARRKLDMEFCDLYAAAAAPPVVAPVEVAVTAPPTPAGTTRDGLKVKQFFDQGCAI